MKPEVKALRKAFNDLRSSGLLCTADNCQKCQRSSDEVFQLELHHKISLKHFDQHIGVDLNAQDNLITLCSDCHKAYHAVYEDLTIDDYINNVQLIEAYRRLQEYRDLKDARRQEAIKKHRGR